MISDSYCGSFPHSLLSTSKKLYTHHKAWSSPLDHHNFIPSGGHHTVWGCWGKSVLKPQKTGQPPNAYCNSYINKLWIVYDSYVILGIRSCFAPAVIQVMQDQSDLNWKSRANSNCPQSDINPAHDPRKLIRNTMPEIPHFKPNSQATYSQTLIIVSA